MSILKLNDLDHSFTWFWLVRRAEIFIPSFPPQPCHLRISAVYYCHKTRMWSYIYISWLDSNAICSLFQSMLYVQMDTQVQSKTMNLRWSYKESIKFTCWIIKNAEMLVCLVHQWYVKTFLTFFLIPIFPTISLGRSEFGTISSSHDRDSRSPIFFPNSLYL